MFSKIEKEHFVSVFTLMFGLRQTCAPPWDVGLVFSDYQTDLNHIQDSKNMIQVVINWNLYP